MNFINRTVQSIKGFYDSLKQPENSSHYDVSGAYKAKGEKGNGSKNYNSYKKFDEIENEEQFDDRSQRHGFCEETRGSSTTRHKFSKTEQTNMFQKEYPYSAFEKNDSGISFDKYGGDTSSSNEQCLSYSEKQTEDETKSPVTYTSHVDDKHSANVNRETEMEKCAGIIRLSDSASKCTNITRSMQTIGSVSEAYNPPTLANQERSHSIDVLNHDKEKHLEDKFLSNIRNIKTTSEVASGDHIDLLSDIDNEKTPPISEFTETEASQGPKSYPSSLYETSLNGRNSAWTRSQQMQTTLSTASARHSQVTNSNSNLSLPGFECSWRQKRTEEYVEAQQHSNKASKIHNSEPNLNKYRELTLKSDTSCHTSVGPKLLLNNCNNISMRFLTPSERDASTDRLDFRRSNRINSSTISSCGDSCCRNAILDTTRNTLDLHKEETCENLSSRFKKCREILDQKGLLFIICKKGDGSSHLGLDLMLLYPDFDPYLVTDPSEFSSCVRSQTRSVILVDDAYGKSIYDMKLKDDWDRKLKRAKSDCQTGSLKLILIVKHLPASIYSDFFSLYEAHIVDLSLPELQLNKDDMSSILELMTTKKRPLKNEHASCIVEIALPMGFPNRVKELLSNVAEDPVDFFQYPSRNLIEHIQHLEKENKDMYLAIVAVTFLKNKLTSKNIFQLLRNELKAESKSRTFMKKRRENTQRAQNSLNAAVQLIRKISANMSTGENLAQVVKRGIRSLHGTLVKTGPLGAYTLSANCVEMAVMLVICKIFPNDVLNLCSERFFHRHVCTDIAIENENDRCFWLVLDNHDQYILAIDKLIDTVLNRKVRRFVSHMCMKDSEFVQLFLEKLKKDKDVFRNIILSADRQTGRSVVSYGFELTFIDQVENEPRHISEIILRHKIWKYIRDQEQVWSRAQEEEALVQCCKYNNEQLYFDLKSTFQVKVRKECLTYCIRTGNSKILKDVLVSTNTNISKEDIFHALLKTCLNYLSEKNKTAMQSIIRLKCYISVDYTTQRFGSVLHYAAKTGNIKLMALHHLIGGTINLKNDRGETCLHVAALSEKHLFVSMAIQYGANQLERDHNNRCPVHIAASLGDSVSVISVLEKNKRNITQLRDNLGRCPLHLAAAKNNVNIVNYLIEKDSDIFKTDYNGDTVLHHACKSGKCEVIQVLLRKGADINAQNKTGITPFQTVCDYENIDGLKCLIANGVDVERPCRNVYPIHHAIEKDDMRMFDALLKAGVSIRRQTLDTLDTVLHIATRNSSCEKVRAILGRDQDLVHERNNQNETALHIAAKNGDVSTAKVLLEFGAKKNILNSERCTPLELAKLEKRKHHYSRLRDNFEDTCRLLSS